MNSVSWVLMVALVIVAWVALHYQTKSITLAEEVLRNHAWIDEIIEALESGAEPNLDERPDRLAD